LVVAVVIIVVESVCVYILQAEIDFGLQGITLARRQGVKLPHLFFDPLLLTEMNRDPPIQ